MADPLLQASAWTDEELDWIESHGGYVYEKTRDATDDQTRSVSDDNAGISTYARYKTDDQIDQEQDANGSVWDKIKDWFSRGIDKAGTVLSDAYDYGKDWIDQLLNREKWADDRLYKNVSTDLDDIIAWEMLLNAGLTDEVDAALAEQTAQAADTPFWQNLAFDFPEFSLDPLAGILGRLVDNIADRINGFIADAMGIEYKR